MAAPRANRVFYEQSDIKELDSMLQCPVCYDIPKGAIFQCNEGHHVCGDCKERVNLCPMCRSFFFGTRNYTLEGLIGCLRKPGVYRIGGRFTSDICTEDGVWPPEGEPEPTQTNANESSKTDPTNLVNSGNGYFRCLCCKPFFFTHVPAKGMLKHLRFYHIRNLIEGKAEGDKYARGWQIETNTKKVVAALYVEDMGIFFVSIEFFNDKVIAWVSMVAPALIAETYCYTLKFYGNDREVIFINTMASVRACENTLKKRGHCLTLEGPYFRALSYPMVMNTKVKITRILGNVDSSQLHLYPHTFYRHLTPNPNRDPSPMTRVLEPYVDDLQDDIARITRAFDVLGHNHLLEVSRFAGGVGFFDGHIPLPRNVEEPRQYSRTARRRMRHRLRETMRRDRRAYEFTSDISDDEAGERILQIPNNYADRKVGLATIQPQKKRSSKSKRSSQQQQQQQQPIASCSGVNSQSGNNGTNRRSRRHRT